MWCLKLGLRQFQGQRMFFASLDMGLVGLGFYFEWELAEVGGTGTWFALVGFGL
jgi:hypothetical protein